MDIPDVFPSKFETYKHIYFFQLVQFSHVYHIVFISHITFCYLIFVGTKIRTYFFAKTASHLNFRGDHSNLKKYFVAIQQMIGLLLLLPKRNVIQFNELINVLHREK